VVQDLGDIALPETAAPVVPDFASHPQTVETQVPPPPITSDNITSASAPDAATPSPTPSSPPEPERKTVTTQERKPLAVPDTVHLRITPENLKDYVGPPIYHKDRFYIRPPPPGVSTGLGYLGNGSGAVMPVEATVGA
jgi:ATP-dependent Lon protease